MGETASREELKEDQVRKIRRLMAEGVSPEELAERFGDRSRRAERSVPAGRWADRAGPLLSARSVNRRSSCSGGTRSPAMVAMAGTKPG